MGDGAPDLPACTRCREVVSARLDGEAGPAEVDRAETHLAGCRACREFAERAARVTRLVRMAPVQPVPDLAGAVADALGDSGAAPPRRRARDLARLGLGAVAAGQVALVVSGVVSVGQAGHGGSQLAGASAAHLVHESSAWNLALGVAFGVVAMSRTQPAGIVPVIGAFLGMLGLLSLLDVAAGRVDLARLVGHALVVAGFALLLLLRRWDRGDGGSAHGGTHGSARMGGAGPAAPARRFRRGTGVAPAGRRVA